MITTSTRRAFIKAGAGALALTAIFPGLATAEETKKRKIKKGIMSALSAKAR
jgi:hypothetical protein